jgi:hypothetical protein
VASKGRPYKTVRVEGHEVLVGRGDVENDELTFTVAEPDDLWLHVAGGVAGSHVVIRNPEKQATLPARSSSAPRCSPRGIRRAGARGRVHWCRVADVRKRRGAPAEVELRRWERIRVSATEPTWYDARHGRPLPRLTALRGDLRPQIQTREREVVGIRGDDADPFSRGSSARRAMR